jgi:hypothetical protein
MCAHASQARLHDYDLFAMDLLGHRQSLTAIAEIHRGEQTCPILIDHQRVIADM